MARLSITAIIIALNEQAFIGTCLRAIYPFVTRIYVISNYDTNYHGHELQPDATVEKVLGFDDREKKVILFVNRKILDETIQRNWAMAADQSLYKASHMQFRPHAHTLAEIREQSPRTDFFWIIDADEIYDPETIPGAIDFLSHTRSSAVLVRGYNFFKSWNYRTNLEVDQFWQIGFLRSGRYFHSRRALYSPRLLVLVARINPKLYGRLAHLYRRETRMPEDIAHFYHGSYVGDNDRIRKKLQSSSHTFPDANEWFENVWKRWHPEMRNFFYSSKPEAWTHAEYIPTAELPAIIRDSHWPPGWIER